MPTRRNKRTSDTQSPNNDRSGSDSTSRHKKQKTNENTNDNTTELNIVVRINFYPVDKGTPIRFDDFGPRINVDSKITDERLKLIVIDNFKKQIKQDNTNK